MPRQWRIQYPGAIDHVMSRGDRRQVIFPGDVERQDFLKTLAEAGEKTGWQMHAYCLMGNHYYLVRTPAHLGQRSDFSRTVIRFNSDAAPN